ncbi:hypothetical protein Pla123a_24890 [Posidoniimonas polymericola]|uniref:Uncharacterized protein n=1 Tax=Posidoniimonas polymericola TaxID=2528002 RepID=A0A5C5YQE1_9BACT|nr:hypothetical protein [Posidoniimonas polymericola]TWT77059.1 hypothetical protein Pla123a_24890 [Posidoniimonas polymericola]
MGKIYAFLLGVAAGFGLYHLAGSYHVLRTDSGLHVAAKTSLTLHDTYVDIRGYGPSDWADHPEVAAAVFKSGDEELKKAAVFEAVDQILPDAAAD